MSKILTQDDLISLLAERARFTKSDSKIFLDSLIQIFEESARDDVILKIRGFGKLYSTIIPARKGRGGIVLDEAKKCTFRLSENIRYAGKRIP